MRRTALIIGGSRWQCDLIKRAAELNLQTIVTDLSMEAPGRRWAHEFVQIDATDCVGLLNIARNRRVDLVLTEQSDRAVPMVALLNQEMGLKGIRPHTANVFTNKHAMRKALKCFDVRMPRYAEVGTVEDAVKFIKECGYPAILKPKNSQSSLGVFKVVEESQLRCFFSESLKESRDGKILVEEFVEGTEVTVEALSVEGQCHVLAISEKEHYSFNDCVARRLVYPPNLDSSTQIRLRDMAARVVELLGLEDGISHGEYRIRDGAPYLIEVAARGGGYRIASIIIQHVSGLDPYEMMIRGLLGEEIRMPAICSRAANLEFLHFEPGRVKAIHGLEEVRASGLVCDIDLHFDVGDVICLPANDKTRLGYFISLGESRTEVDDNARRVRDMISVEYVD